MSAGGLLEARIELTRSDRFQLRVELSVPSGTTIALLGPNGAGKSSVVAAIAGLLPIDSGRISIGDTLLDEPGKGRFVPPEDRRVGVVFQDFLLFPHLSVVDNVAFGPRSRGISRDESRSMALRAIDDMGLGGLADQRPGELSGGQAQRVALARALAAEPDVLLLDEPLSSLDVTTRWQLRHLLGERLVAFAGPRVLVTHDPAEAFLLADEVYVIESGRITQSGTPDDIRIRPRTSFAAGLAGVNLFSGRAVEGGAVDISGHLLNVVDGESAGEVLVIIHPQAISVHTEAPRGSPRNVWETTVEVLEVIGDRARLRCAAPLPITAELTLSSVSELGLRAGSRVWLAVKATEIRVETVSGGSQEA